MSDEREEIRSRISIVDLVGQSVALKKAGKNWKGLCPFHDDRNPSFVVSDTTGHYRCWSCGEKGDIFNWVMKTQNVDFADALKILADRAGVTLRRGATPTDKSQRETRKTIMEEALAFFVEALGKTKAARDYVSGRDLGDETLKQWELGFAPEGDHALTLHLRKKGLPLSEAKQLFLVDEDSGGGFFDKFRGRLMFPIRDERGELVAFGGRLLGDGHPKYINSGDTPIFRKSKVLYGLHQAKEAVQKSGKAVLVEGYLDVIACHRAGIKNAVASLGTSLTEEHARLLKRWCEEVIVFYDGDAAGQKAALRALEVLAEAGNKVRVSLLPNGQDPDTLLKGSGADAVQRAVEEGLSPLSFRLAGIEATMKPSDEGFWTEIVRVLALSDSITAVQAEVVRLVHRYLPGQNAESAEKSLLNDIRRSRSTRERIRHTQTGVVSLAKSAADRPFTATETVVFNALLQEATRDAAWAALSETNLFGSPAARDLAAAICQSLGASPPLGPANEWIGKIEPESARLLLVSVDEPLFVATPDSLEANLRLLRAAREKRFLAEMPDTERSDSLLEQISAKLREAARLDPFRHFEDG